MRIARLLIYEGTEEALKRHFAAPGCWVNPGQSRGGGGAHDQSLTVTITEPVMTDAGGRVRLLDGEIPCIKVIR